MCAMIKLRSFEYHKFYTPLNAEPTVMANGGVLT